MNRGPDRRRFLGLMAGLPLLAAPTRAVPAPNKGALIERLMREARSLPHVGQRIDFISGKLLGTKYQADTLIGSPAQPEQFVVRDDVFDCVTFCEVVLAASVAHSFDDFDATLRSIRYDHGAVQYDQRNHYFADWCQRNIENGICRPVAIEPTVALDRTVSFQREFKPKVVKMSGVDKATLLAGAKKLAPGDIIGFVSRRPGLDYYHTGFIAFGKRGELMLRSASLSHGRVLDEPMSGFVTANPVHYVTLLRAAEIAPVAERR